MLRDDKNYALEALQNARDAIREIAEDIGETRRVGIIQDALSAADAEIVRLGKSLLSHGTASGAVPMPRSAVEWLARQQLENDEGRDAYVAMEAVAAAQNALKALESMPSKGRERLWDLARMLEFQAKQALDNGRMNIEIDAKKIVPQIVAVMDAAAGPEATPSSTACSTPLAPDYIRLMAEQIEEIASNMSNARGDRLRAYGNAINAEVAAGFIRAYIEQRHG